MNANVLLIALFTAGLLQGSVAILNLGLPRLMGWRAHLPSMPLLMAEVFTVHLWFITVTLLIFAVLTVRFAGELAAGTNLLGAYLAAGIGLFWGLRTVIQWVYYSPSHWRGRAGRTAIHVALLLVYGGMSGAYLAAAVKGLG